MDRLDPGSPTLFQAYLDTLPADERDADGAALAELSRHSEPEWAARSWFMFDAKRPPAVRRALAIVLGRERLSHQGLHDLRDRLNDGTQDLAELEAWAQDPPLAGVFKLYAHALRAVPSALWPPAPLDRGEIAPRPLRGWAAALARFLVPRFEGHDALQERLRGAAVTEATITGGVHAGASLRPHLIACMKGLADAAPAKVTPTLEAISEELRRLDVLRALVERKQTPSTGVARCVFRGDDGKRATLHLCELDDGSFGLLFKARGRYRWLEGAREDVVANVPEVWFARAMEAM